LTPTFRPSNQRPIYRLDEYLRGTSDLI
jgi:hypothetical protein